jgi:SH3-like domain-containing protein
MKRNILLTIAILSFLTGAFGQKKAEAVKTCKVSAYIADADPNGLNVRATPDKNGAILKRLVRGGGDISLDIIGSAGTGWVKITNAWHGDTDEEFKGSGWVFASLLATGTRGYPNYDSPAKLYSEPDKKGKVSATLPAEAEATVLDCAGRWIKISYQGKIGWLAPENQCGSPFTTCS